MMRIVITALILIGCILTGLEAYSLSSDMEFTISLDKPEGYKAQDSININFKLKNKGSKPVYVNKRFHLSSEENSVKERDVFLSITSPSGEKLSYKYPYAAGFPKSDYFVLLKPGEEAVAERPRNINGTFDFSEPGDYVIKAVYQNDYGPEIGLDVFKDRIESNAVTVKISK